MTPGKGQIRASHRLSLRPAEEGDCMLLWRWRNEEDTRKWSFDTDYVSYEEHRDWFSNKINSPDSKIFIILNEENREIGQVRFDIGGGGSADVGINIAAQERDKGYGSAALRAACQQVKKELNIGKVIAHIKEGNQASVSAFTGAGFKDRGLVAYKGHKAIEMVWG